jgi:hypothetical protein
MGLAPPWRRPTLGWLVWSVPPFAGMPAALRACHAMPVDAHGVFWVPPAESFEAAAAWCVVVAKDTPGGRASLQRSARHAVDEALAAVLPPLEALLGDGRSSPAQLIRALDALDCLQEDTTAWATALELAFPRVSAALVDYSARVDAVLTSRLVA